MNAKNQTGRGQEGRGGLLTSGAAGIPDHYSLVPLPACLTAQNLH